jgi:FtsP/CotA-like multicopper oxidase with cupredoxin domain
MKRSVLDGALAAVVGILLVAMTCVGATAAVRQYYIAADEVDWDFMPGGLDQMMGMAPMGYAKFFATRGPHLIGHVYRKAVYREYTDATFDHLKPRSAADAYLGILGPIIHAEVGDTIRIVFKNNTTHPCSMHPHGVRYEKASEGSPYNDGVPDSQKPGDSVAPGHTFTYVWEVPPRAGPGPNDPSSIVWLYHSHVHERQDVNAGLIGAIIVTRKGMARPDGTPKDVDHEFVALFMIFNENSSWLLDQSIKKFTTDPAHVIKFEAIPKDPDGNFDPFGGTGFVGQNFRATINGYQYADGPMMRMKKGDHVRWYLITLGEGLNFHTPHWHGNTVLVRGSRTDVVSLGPAQMITADMHPDAPGVWLFHCHISEHMDGGMAARYEVLP